MFEEAFEKLELDKIALVLDQVNPKLEGAQFDPVESTVLALDLAFYPGYQLLDIADHTNMPPKKRFVVYAHDDVTVLDFTNEPIYALNERLPIMLDERNVKDYVRFFFSYVRGRHGRFIITEGVDEIAWKEDPPPAARKAISRMIEPVVLKSVDPVSGDYSLSACMMFKDSLFKSDVTVFKGGTVKLSNEELLIEDMPVLDDTFGQ